MNFTDELKQISIDELGADINAIKSFKFNNLDPTYLKSILERPFNRAHEILLDLQNRKKEHFKQSLYDLISKKSASGYTRKFAKTLLIVSFLSQMINFEEYKNILQEIFNEKPDKLYAENIEIEKNKLEEENAKNRDPFAPLYNSIQKEK